jgi:hypothetical protein
MGMMVQLKLINSNPLIFRLHSQETFPGRTYPSMPYSNERMLVSKGDYWGDSRIG